MKKFIFFVGFAFLLSCDSTPTKDNLPMSREEFKTNLKAIHLFEAGLSNSIFVKDTLNPKLLIDYDSIFKSNNSSKEDFVKTYDAYYEYFIDDFDSLYAEIENDFIILRDSLEKSRQLEKKLELKDVNNTRVIDEQVVEEKLSLNPMQSRKRKRKKLKVDEYDD